MKPILKYTAALLAVVTLGAGALGLGACERRGLVEDIARTVRIPVKIDWSQSNIPVTTDDPTGGDLIHRVSFRFYPEDGSAIFERYLEGNIFEGEIEVPIGKYKVIVMNESVEDTNYWEDHITFSDTNDYDKFSATVKPLSDAQRQQQFPYYHPGTDEQLIVEPLRLSSWSLEDFEVTRSMAEASRGDVGTSRADISTAFSNIVMRRLTYNVKVTARVTNLVSVAQMPTAIRGLADRVFLASAQRTQSPSTYLFLLNGRLFDANGLDGTTTKTFLSFGRLPEEPAGSYHLLLDILLTTGELFTETGPLDYDVTSQVLESIDLDIALSIPDESGGSIELPFVDGGVFIGDWDDEVINIQ